MWLSVIPKFFQNKRAIVNIQNVDERSYGYAIVSAFNPVEIKISPPEKYTEEEDL